MKKIIFISVFLISILSINAQSKQDSIVQVDIPLNSILSPTFMIGDLVFISEALKSVEIKATEADAYIMVDEKLKMIIENPQVKARPIDEAVLVDIDYLTLKNISFLMERAKFTASNAIRLKRFNNSIKEAEVSFVNKNVKK